MRKHVNACGVRNAFGYFDSCNKSVILKHPFFKKAEIADAYTWIDSEPDLRKLSIGIGLLDNVVADDSGDNLYGAARGIIHQNLSQSQKVDNEILKNILQRLKGKKSLSNLSLKCYLFSDDPMLFDLLLQIIKSTPSLIYLDLCGCYFSDEQLLELAEVISKMHIAHLVWPEPRMTEKVTNAVSSLLANCLSLVVMHGVPLDFQQIALKNRQQLFSYARRPTLIGEDEAKMIKEYGNSIRIAIAYEKQRLFDLEKAFEAVLA